MCWTAPAHSVPGTASPCRSCSRRWPARPRPVCRLPSRTPAAWAPWARWSRRPRASASGSASSGRAAADRFSSTCGFPIRRRTGSGRRGAGAGVPGAVGSGRSGGGRRRAPARLRGAVRNVARARAHRGVVDHGRVSGGLRQAAEGERHRVVRDRDDARGSEARARPAPTPSSRRASRQAAIAARSIRPRPNGKGSVSSRWCRGWPITSRCRSSPPAGSATVAAWRPR